MNIMDSLKHLDEMCPTGYAMALHIRYTTPRFLFQTYADEWKKIYSDQGLVLKDPTVIWGFGNSGVTRWSNLADIDEAGMLDLAKKYGLNFGFTYAIDLEDSKSIASFSREGAEFSDEQITEATEIALNIHNITADVDEFSADDLTQLKKMSIDFTHG